MIFLLLLHFKVYPNDPHDNSYWSKYGGLGQITDKGLVGSYKLGQSIKNYYSKLINILKKDTV